MDFHLGCLSASSPLAGTTLFSEYCEKNRIKNTQHQRIRIVHKSSLLNLMAMDLFTFVSALLALCFQATPLAHGFSSQIFIHANPPLYQNGRLASSGDEDAASNVRKPWDVLRFVSQSSKFVKAPSLPLIGVGQKGIKRKVGPGM
jgi:hypothetical protein